MRELRHLCGHLQPDFGEWVGVAPSMSLKNDLFFAIFYALAICHFAWPRKTGPTKSEKELFPEFPQRKLDTWWGPFSGANSSGKLALRWFPPIFFSTSSCLFGA